MDQICLVSYGNVVSYENANGGGIPVESANLVHNLVCGHVIADKIGISCNSGILEISV